MHRRKNKHTNRANKASNFKFRFFRDLTTSGYRVQSSGAVSGAQQTVGHLDDTETLGTAESVVARREVRRQIVAVI